MSLCLSSSSSLEPIIVSSSLGVLHPSLSVSFSSLLLLIVVVDTNNVDLSSVEETSDDKGGDSGTNQSKERVQNGAHLSVTKKKKKSES